MAATTLHPPLALEPVIEPPIVRPASTGGVVRAAAIISLGNILSRLFGLARETVIADLFGATGYVSIFRLASTVIQTLYDFLVGGAVSAALVPVFSEFSDRREELWRISSIVLSVLALMLAATVIALEILAPQLVLLLGPGYDPELQTAAVSMVRLILPAVFFLGVAGILTGLLYSVNRFAYPAFTTAAYNLAIIVVAIALSRQFEIMSLIIGILVGAASQVLLQLPGLRDWNFRPSFDFRHPALRRILKLYLPVVLGLTVNLVGVTIDRNLVSRTGSQSLAWMQDATVLVQLPLGLVVTAISFAILPSLSRAASSIDFKSTLAFGLKLVLLLILPATAGLYLLARPIVALLFEHGAFTAVDTAATADALKIYLLGLPFASIDQPLVFAFYARKNTLLPNLVAIVGVATYLVVALVLIQPYGYLGLVLANSAQLTVHALVMLYLTRTRLGGLSGNGLVATTFKLLVSTAAMAAVTMIVSALIPGGGGFAGKLLSVAVPTAPALIVFVFAVKLLRVSEADQLWGMVLAKLRWGK